jgi:hypothetical protein
MTTVNQENNDEKTGRSAQNILALALAALGVEVFPCRRTHEYRDGKFYRGAKSPLTPRGFKDATTDPATIDAWWAEFPDALVGWLPVSVDCAVLDLDNKNGKDGIHELETRELDFLSTLWYCTPSGGEHHVFREPWARKVGPQQDYLGFPGVDIRSGGSYAIWYGEAPTSLEDIPEMPEWIRQGKRKSRKRGSASGPRVVNGQRNYEGELEEWFDWLGYENPWWAALRIEEEIEYLNHVGHDDLIRLTWRIHQSRLSGAVGLGAVALLLVDNFRSTTNNQDGWERELEDAIRGAIGPDWTPDAQPETIAAAGGDDIA